jgi:hypothetical protein
MNWKVGLFCSTAVCLQGSVSNSNIFVTYTTPYINLFGHSAMDPLAVPLLFSDPLVATAASPS